MKDYGPTGEWTNHTHQTYRYRAGKIRGNKLQQM
jgi:hypothetical protein